MRTSKIGQPQLGRNQALIVNLIALASLLCLVSPISAQPAYAGSDLDLDSTGNPVAATYSASGFTAVSTKTATDGFALFAAPALAVKTSKPTVSGVDGSREVRSEGTLTLTGDRLLLVQKVLVDGVETSFAANSDGLLTIKIPKGLKPGDVSIRLVGSFGDVLLSNFITIAPIDISISSKVTIGTFNGYVAVYTKNLEGKSLSIQVGNRWRVVPNIPTNYTKNLLKQSIGKLVETKVYIDRQLVKIRTLRVR